MGALRRGDSLGDGNWWIVERHEGPVEVCVVLSVTDDDLWLSPDEARLLADALRDMAVGREVEAA